MSKIEQTAPESASDAQYCLCLFNLNVLKVVFNIVLVISYWYCLDRARGILTN